MSYRGRRREERDDSPSKGKCSFPLPSLLFIGGISVNHTFRLQCCFNIPPQMCSGALHMNCILVEFAQHYRALQGSNEHRGTGIPIHFGSNFVPLNALVDDALNGSSQNVHRAASTVAQAWMRIVSLDGCIEDKATTDKHGIFQ